MSDTPIIERENRSPSPFIQSLSPEERREFLTEAGRKGNERRLVLNGEEAAALGQVYLLLDKIYHRHAAKLDAAADRAEAADG